MWYFKLNTDGTIQCANKQHEGFLPSSLLIMQEDDTPYQYYLLVDGVYVADEVKITEDIIEKENSDILQEIAALEVKAGPRAVREPLIAHPDIDTTYLEPLEQEIQELRKKLR